MARVERSDGHTLDGERLANLERLEELAFDSDGCAQHARREPRAVDCADVKGAMQTTGVVRVGVREKIVAYLGLEEVEAVNDERVERRAQPLEAGVLRGHDVAPSPRAQAARKPSAALARAKKV